jgi:Xaa-Pro aminopeptidase
MNEEPAIEGTGSGPAGEAPPPNRAAAKIAGRKAEVDAKQTIVARLLQESNADGLLLFDPANLAWFTGAAICQNVPDPNDWPAVFLLPEQRWLLSGNADTQRIFDVHLDGLGFQLKEWPWHWGREQLLADLVQNRKIACDRVLANSIPMGPTFRRLRLALTSAERDRLASLGSAVAHAIEATCRNLEIGQLEHEVAGEVGHRLLKHGVVIVGLDVAADGRGNRHRRPGVTAARIQYRCVVAATGQRHGLHVTAARSVTFGAADAVQAEEHTAACRIAASLVSAARPRAALADVLEAGRIVAELNDHEPDWFRGPTGHITGWLPVERQITPTLTYQFGSHWAVVWQAGIGTAFVADTWLVGDTPVCVTTPESWPIKRHHIGEKTLDMPDLLVRER